MKLYMALIALPLAAQANLDFEKGSLEGWFAPAALADYKAAWVSEGCAKGGGCAEVGPVTAAPKNFGNLMQSIDATPYRGKRIRYRAMVRTEGMHRGQLWLRVDRPSGIGFFENMGTFPIVTNGEWKSFEINGFVHADATRVNFGVMAFTGPVRMDEASLEITGELPQLPMEPARELTAAGLRNLEAFARLYGLVRHFDPSVAARSADWDRLAIEGSRKAEGAADPAKTLEEIFRPVSPGLRVAAGRAPELAAMDREDLVRYRHNGYGQAGRPGNIYSTVLVAAEQPAVHTASIGAGLTAVFPLTAKRGEAKAGERPLAELYDAADRGTRLGTVIIAWNIFRHFYPYFDVAGADWEAELDAALRRAATDNGGVAFQGTLRRMVARLKDGHGNVYGKVGPARGSVPLQVVWVEDRLLLAASRGVWKAGDEIVAIDGTPASRRMSELEESISSATPQWARRQAARESMQCVYGAKITLSLRAFGSTETRDIEVPCSERPGQPSANAKPAAAIRELQGGHWYVDLTSATDADFTAAIPKLAGAKGIVFDLRGYPRVSPAWLSHLSKTELRSAQWHVPLIERPGHMEFTRQGEWRLQPKEPYLAAPRVFLTDGGAISYAESTMGIVEAYKLGEIIGEATAGTNGNVNPILLPGGFNVTWTGMKVIKHDGTRHHGVGIRPTVPLQPTQAGIAAGRDELLERAVALLTSAAATSK